MNAYAIFDDFGPEASKIIADAGVKLTVHPLGKPRPSDEEMVQILEEYDCIIIGTSQRIYPWMFDKVITPKIIATASVGTDHIVVPDEKKQLIKIINAPKSNAQSVAEYTLAAALSCVKRLDEGKRLFLQGMNNKKISSKPEDLSGKTMGVIGAGNVSLKTMELASAFGMEVVFWTAHPEKHQVDSRFRYLPLEKLVATADVLSVNLPDKPETKGIISAELVNKMKDSCIFVSVSRLSTVNLSALIERARSAKSFFVNLDLDNDETVASLAKGAERVNITPHIAGGTVESRKRMFLEIASGIRDVFADSAEWGAE